MNTKGIYKNKIEQIYELYEQPLYRIAYAILNNIEQAEDAVSNAFEIIIKNKNKINKVDSIETKNYVVRIVRSTAIDLYRSNVRTLASNVFIDNELVDTLSDDSKTEEAVISKLDVEIILNKLTEDERRLVELRCIQGFDWRETAKELDITETTARKRLERIRKKIANLKGV